MQAVCERYGVPIRAAALQFPLAHPAVASIVIGSESREQYAEAFDGLCLEIPPGLWQDLRATGLIDPAAPVPGEV
jgi:D-threo-aldose 1-dehydrogenase